MRHEKTFHREDGSTVVIVIIGMHSLFTMKMECDMFAIVKKNNEANKYYHPSRSVDKNLKTSVSEYVSHGRKGLMSVARPHEVIKTRLEFDELWRCGEMANAHW